MRRIPFIILLVVMLTSPLPLWSLKAMGAFVSLSLEYNTKVAMCEMPEFSNNFAEYLGATEFEAERIQTIAYNTYCEGVDEHVY